MYMHFSCCSFLYHHVYEDILGAVCHSFTVHVQNSHFLLVSNKDSDNVSEFVILERDTLFMCKNIFSIFFVN